MSKQLPNALNQFRKRHLKVWRAFNELGQRCHEAGPWMRRVAVWSNLPCRLERDWKALRTQPSEARGKQVSPRTKLITLRCLRSPLSGCPPPPER